jgi:hypothetical protein
MLRMTASLLFERPHGIVPILALLTHSVRKDAEAAGRSVISGLDQTLPV